jgi:tyrosyl-tRNA synthetase
MFAKVLSISDTLMWRWYTAAELPSEAEIAALQGRGRPGATPRTPR